MAETTIIEINGVKMEVDLRTAKRVDNIKIGDRVKVLKKTYDSHEVYTGIVVGFEPFAKLPTIIVAYAESSWSATSIKFLHYNSATKDSEIVVSNNADFDDDRERIVAGFQRDIEKKRAEISALEEQLKYFQTNFGAYWSKVTMTQQAESSL